MAPHHIIPPRNIPKPLPPQPHIDTIDVPEIRTRDDEQVRPGDAGWGEEDAQHGEPGEEEVHVGGLEGEDRGGDGEREERWGGAGVLGVEIRGGGGEGVEAAPGSRERGK